MDMSKLKVSKLKLIKLKKKQIGNFNIENVQIENFKIENLQIEKVHIGNLQIDKNPNRKFSNWKSLAPLNIPPPTLHPGRCAPRESGGPFLQHQTTEECHEFSTYILFDNSLVGQTGHVPRNREVLNFYDSQEEWEAQARVLTSLSPLFARQ